MSDGDLRRVVIADDDGDVRELLTEYLGRHGWQVFEAVNGLEALLHVKRQRPHAVLLDLRMPRLGGIETLKRIRAFDPTITVVILSGTLDPEPRREAETTGAAAVLDKPVDLRGVLAALDAGRSTPSPVAVAAGASTAPSPAPTVAARPSPSRTVLVVDDDPDIRAMLEEFLLSKGYRVRSAADGAAALRELVAASADVVLLDIDMPGLSGSDALPTLRAVAPRAAIIMVSGTTNEQTAKRTLAAGAFDYLTKPIDLVRLIDTMQTALAMHDVAL
jgi:two-component system OmpR family response regulator